MMFLSSLLNKNLIGMILGAGLAGLVALLMIKDLKKDLAFVTLERDSARQQVIDLAKINADNLKAFNQAQADFEKAVSVLNDTLTDEASRRQTLAKLLMELDNAAKSDACFNSEPVRRALDWLRTRDSSRPIDSH